MKTKTVFGIGAALCSLFTAVDPAFAQGTAFTYQGRLNDGANPANGTYNLRFALFDALTVGNQSGLPLTNSPVNVSNGLFTVALDFGANFPGADRWLEIGVRTNGNGTFSTLSPRQKITPTPYAIYAAGASAAGISGTIPTANLTGTYGSAVTFNNPANSFSGNGTGLTNVNAISLGGFGASSFWNLGGNAGTTPGTQFLGTTDNVPMEFKVNGARALRLEPNPNAPNVIGGSAANEVTNGIYGAVIAGGGSSFYPNRVGAIFGTVMGGNGNTASGNFATAMGQFNTASGYAGTAMGYSTVAGGFGSQAGGTTAKANHDGAFVWADNNFTDFTSTAVNQFLIRAAGGVGINTNNPHGAALAVNGNATIGGILSAIAGLNATEIGTPGNQPLELRANGQLGLRLDPGATAADLTAPGNLSFGTQTRQMLNLWGMQYGIGVQTATVYFRTDNAGANNGFAWFKGGTHSDGVADAGGGTTLMTLTSAGLAVNGTGNGVQGTTSSGGASAVYGQNDGGGFGVAGRTTGAGSAVFGDNASPTGWAGNFNGNVSVAGNQFFGSQLRQMLNLWGTQYGIGVQSGTLYFRTDNSSINNGFAWYKGGVHNDGQQNAGGGAPVMTLDGNGLNVLGTATITAGRIFADDRSLGGHGNQGNAVSAESEGPNSSAVRAVDSDPTGWAGDFVGRVRAEQYLTSSDRNVKTHFEPVSAREILAKVAALPITRWNFTNDLRTAHLGPVAQDFKAAFDLGSDDKTIATVDADGVALAAIQGLNQKMDSENATLRAENAELEQRLEKLEQLIHHQNGGEK
jgi:Chaperone of endosialidase